MVTNYLLAFFAVVAGIWAGATAYEKLVPRIGRWANWLALLVLVSVAAVIMVVFWRH